VVGRSDNTRGKEGYALKARPWRVADMVGREGLTGGPGGDVGDAPTRGERLGRL
jgi:hypothetical protein